jgi:hypothetical protein
MSCARARCAPRLIYDRLKFKERASGEALPERIAVEIARVNI